MELSKINNPWYYSRYMNNEDIPELAAIVIAER